MNASSTQLLLLPYEATTSYQPGTAGGPRSLLPHLTPEPFPTWISVEAGGLPAEEYLARVAGEVEKMVSTGWKVAAVGGEHTVTYGILAGLLKAGRSPAVIQLDAHADLREEYEGTPWSHACVMRRIEADLGLPYLGVGIRSLSKEEAAFAGEAGIPLVFANQLINGLPLLAGRAAAIGPDIYLTVDIDFFDPSVVPGTGTPEPGGPGWYQGLSVIETLLAGKKLVGFDLVEYSPAVEEGVTVRAAAGLFRQLLRYL